MSGLTMLAAYECEETLAGSPALPTEELPAGNSRFHSADAADALLAVGDKEHLDADAGSSSEQRDDDIGGNIVRRRFEPCYTKGCLRRLGHRLDGSGTVFSCLYNSRGVQGMLGMRGAQCEFRACEVDPFYALTGEKHGRCCKKHKSSEMVFINSRHCDVSDCPSSALWREATERKKCVCQDHREKGVAYSQIAAVCGEKGCFEEPCFGIATSGKSLYCAKHKTDDKEEFRSRNCAKPGCGKIPCYGVGGKREMCRDHKTKGMTYAALTCESPRCNKNPSFALRGETRRRFCKLHAEPHMVNVYYKYCGVGACPERASFENGDKLRCLAHIEPGMKPRNNICQVAGGGCTRQSSYGPDGGKPVVCTMHREPGMVQVRTKKCKHPGCEKIPSYGYPCMSREYCKPHALEGMIYSAGGQCRFRGCRAAGVFNHPGVRWASFCQKHKEDGMVDIRPTKCEEVGCNYAASFGDPLEKKKFCSRHKRPGMVNTKNMSAAIICPRTPSSPTDSTSSASGNASSGGGEARPVPNASASETMFADAAKAKSINPAAATPGAVVSGGTNLHSLSSELAPDPFPMVDSVLSGTLTARAVSSTSKPTSAEAVTTISAISASRMPPLPASCTSTRTSSSSAASGVALSAFDPTGIRATQDTSAARRGKKARKDSAAKTAASAGRDFQLPAIPAAASTTTPATAIGLTTAPTADHSSRLRAPTTISATPAFTAIPHFTRIRAGYAAQPQAQASGFGSSSAHVNPAAMSRHPGSFGAAAVAASGAAGMSIQSRWARLLAGIDGGGNLSAANSMASADTAAECRVALPAAATCNTPIPIATLQKLQSGASAGITLHSQDLQPAANTAATLWSSGGCLASVSEDQGLCSPTSTAGLGGICSTHTREPGYVQCPVSPREDSGSDPPSSPWSTRRAGDHVRKPVFGGVTCSGGGRIGTGTSTNYRSALSSSTTSSNQLMSSSSALSSIRGTMATANTTRDYYLVDASVGSGEPRGNGVKISKSTVGEETFLSTLLLAMMDPADPQTARVKGAMMARLTKALRTRLVE